MTHHGTLLLAAGQQRVLRIGIVQVQQGGQALAHNNVSINQGWYLAAGVQCHDLRALVLLCSTIQMMREPLHSCTKTKCAQQDSAVPECSDASAQKGEVSDYEGCKLSPQSPSALLQCDTSVSICRRDMYLKYPYRCP